MLADTLLGREQGWTNSRWLSFGRDQLREDYDRRPFLLQHRLAEHDLFQLPKLVALAERQQGGERALHWRGDLANDADFDHLYEMPSSARSAADAIRRLLEEDSVIVINHPEHDPLYRELIRELYAEIRAQVVPVDSAMTEVMSYIFISSPGSTTPYHMDRELNFLLQIRGSKTVNLWDPTDRNVMSELEVEQLFSRADLPRPAYREGLRAAARTFELKPGLGVHHPFIAPHLVKNQDEVSISLALTYRTRRTEKLAAAYKANYYLRRLGISPSPIGQYRAADTLKADAYNTLLPLARVMRAGLGAASTLVGRGLARR